MTKENLMKYSLGTVKGVMNILEKPEPGSYRRARGVLTWTPGDEMPEAMIRRLRDG